MSDRIEPEPPFAETIFGNQIARARGFVRNLATEGELRGLIGPQELARIWTRHITNCALLAPLIPAGSTVADVGSGAGLPGIVLAIARPDVHMILIEPMDRRAQWLREQVDALDLTNVDVRRARAEDLVGLNADVVTARAVSALRSLIPLVVPLVRHEGLLLLMKGAAAQTEIDAARKQIARFHLNDVEIVELGGPDSGDSTWVVRAKVVGSAR